MEKLIIGGAIFVTAVLAVKEAISNKLTLREYAVKSDKLSESICIVHVSDLHESRFGDGQQKLLSAVREAQPDLIVITGDIIEDDESDPAEGQVLDTANATRPLLEALPKIAPTYMVLGNHESNIPNTDLLCEEIEALGLRVLHRRNPDDSDMFETELIKGQTVRICGADDPYFDRREPQKKHRGMAQRLREDGEVNSTDKSIWRERLRDEYADIEADSALTLLLSHRPEEYDLYRELSFDAAFSGHAHGGQWRLPPFINGVYAPHQGFFPKHAGGCYRYGGFTHIVSRGLSKKRMVRIFNRPELCVVRFEPKGK